MWAVTLLALFAGIGVYGAWSRHRTAGREQRTLAQLRARRTVEEAVDGGSVVVLHRSLPVTVGFGVPEGRDWNRGLVASAPYVLGGGPRFSAAPTDITAHTRPANGASRLRARFEHLYELTGDHREARGHVLAVLDRTDSSELPAPLFAASHGEVRVYLPEHIPGDDDPGGQRCIEQLVALTGELAHFGADALTRYSEALEGRVVLDRDPPDGSPQLTVRFDALGRPGMLELCWVPVSALDETGYRFQLQLKLPREGSSEPDLARAVRALDDLGERETAARVLARAQVAVVSEEVQLVLGSLPSPDELPLVVRVLRRMAGEGSADAPFR